MVNKHETRTLKTFLVEFTIYVAFLAGYLYLTANLSSDWLISLYHQFQRPWLAGFLQDVNLSIVLVLGLLVLAIVLFALEVFSVDIITLILLMGLVVSGILTPGEAFAGFSNDIIIILTSIFVISGALRQTGILDAVGLYLLKIAGHSSNRLIIILMTMVGGMSMFMNNTTTTAVFIPPTIGLAHRLKISASKLLMPLAFASMLGGTATLIGTSTNVAVSGFIAQAGLEPLSLFELMPIGLIILAVGMLYMSTIGHRLLPDHHDENLTDDYAMRKYLSEVIVMPESDLAGQRIFESDLANLDFRILAVLRGHRKFQPNSRSRIEAGDILLVQGKVEELMKVKETADIEIRPELELGLEWQNEETKTNGSVKNGEGDNIKIAEALIIPQSDLVGRTLKSAGFFQRYGLTVLAIHRHGQSLRSKIGRIRLRLGDLLLVQGPAERLEFLRRSPDFWILEELNSLLYRKRKGLYTLGFLAAAIITGGIGWLPLSIAFLGAAVLTVIFGCIAIEEAYEFVDWRLIILIGGMTAFGVAMEKTGAAEFLAHWIITGLETYGVTAIMAGFLGLTILLTQPMSNAAAALVVLPVALHSAQRLGVNERTFAIAIMLAASISFIAPFEPSCVLVYSPGKYKFMDFIKIGWGLTFVLMIVVLFLIPVFWPL
ncbi:MAG: SLC13 family permease [Chloroflexota bacterium]